MIIAICVTGAVLVGHIAVTRRYPVSDTSNSVTAFSFVLLVLWAITFVLAMLAPAPGAPLAILLLALPLLTVITLGGGILAAARDLLCRKTQSLQPESELREEPSGG